MFELIKRMITLGAGLAILTTEKIEEIVNDMIKKGQLSDKEGKDLIAFLTERSKKFRDDLGEKTNQIIQDSLRRLNIPTRKEMDELKKRVEDLEKASAAETGLQDRTLLE